LSVVGSYTLSDVKLEKHFKGSLPVENFNWQVGVIVGRSGSGKTSIAKQLFPDAYVRGFEYKSKCVLDDFPESLETGEITRTLCSVGFASPPDWLKAYDCLSQGEKMRVDIARALCLDKPLIVFDEFTSVVDREIAKVSAFAISKAVRRSKKRFVAVTCHYDVVDWLEPDWVFCTDTMEFARKKRVMPPVELKVYRCGAWLWTMFRQYHYLNGSLPSTARCYTAVYQGKPIAFIAVVHVRMRASYYRVSRLVVLPDYQGIGVGKRLLNFLAELYTSQTKMPFYILTSNPQIIHGSMKNWKISRLGHASKGQGDTRINNELQNSLSRKRITVTLAYVPSKK
jgi:GNAT superfamily N-acetyltransferase